MSEPEARPVDARARLLLGLASVAVAFAAADTYVVVLALPDMMASVGVPLDQLQRAAPIISGFLLGYVAMLPLIGRIADLRGRVPVLVAALVLFAIGSLITTLAYDMPSMVGGRFLQGVGGGGLVPATLALVADLYPVERRGVPLGIVSAVQELGSVIGPLFGALVLAVADWRAIFAINLAVGLVLAAAIHVVSAPDGGERRSSLSRPPDWLGMLLLLVVLVAGTLVFLQPPDLLRDLTWGQLFIPVVGDGRWLTPLGLTTIVALVLFLLRCATAARPLVDVRGWLRSMREADLAGALLLAVALAGVILAFATADPRIQVFSDQGLWYLLGAAVAAAAFVVHLLRAEAPLIPHGALVRTPAWGSMLVSFFVGAALIAALIDIPIFARTTTYPDSQLMAALVLVRFLVALPVGAVVGGYLTRTLPAGVVTAAGMVVRGGRLRLDELVGADRAGELGGDRAAADRRLRLRPRPRARQRSRPRHDGRRRPRPGVGVRGRRPDGRHAGRRLRAHHDRAPALLRRAVGPPQRPRGLRRLQPLLRVHPAAARGRHRPGAGRVPRRSGLRGHRRDPRPGAVPGCPDPRRHHERDAAHTRMRVR